MSRILNTPGGIIKVEEKYHKELKNQIEKEVKDGNR